MHYYVQSEEAVIPPEGSNVGATDELQSKVGELEDKVKDLEQKVTNLFMDNVALKTKLEASQEVERQQQQEITHLKERLVQALRPQVSMHFWDLYCMYPFSAHIFVHNRTRLLKSSHCQGPGSHSWRRRLRLWKKRDLIWRQNLRN